MRKKELIENPSELAEYIGFYLSETIDNLTSWDCEHLAINMIRELDILKPDWWNKRIKKGGEIK